jgi:hypothetical protein
MIEPELNFPDSPEPKIILLPDFSHARFNGPVYVPKLDQKRLALQIERVFAVMATMKWRTLREIESLTGDPPASISAQLRHLRKERNGSYRVEKQRRGNEKSGLWEYQLRPPRRGVEIELDLTSLDSP